MLQTTSTDDSATLRLENPLVNTVQLLFPNLVGLEPRRLKLRRWNRQCMMLGNEVNLERVGLGFLRTINVRQSRRIVLEPEGSEPRKSCSSVPIRLSVSLRGRYRGPRLTGSD
jgi:hypothetical protein